MGGKRQVRQGRRKARRKRRQKGGDFDIQKAIEGLGIEFHPYSFSKGKKYQYLGPGTFLKKRLARGDPGINRLDRVNSMILTILRQKTSETSGKQMIKWSQP